MSGPPDNPQQEPDPEQPDPDQPRADEEGRFSQRVRHQQISARVPESVARGVYANTSLVLQGNYELIIDFLQSVTRPHRVAARVVLPIQIMQNVIDALQQNIDKYTERFGAPPELPQPSEQQKQQQQQNPPSVEEIYENLKIDDEVAAGAYANTVMISHGPSEFCFDFISNFYPRSTVSARVYVSAAQGPRLRTTLQQSLDRVKEQVRKRQQQNEDQPGTGPSGLSGPAHGGTDPTDPTLGEEPPGNGSDDEDRPGGPDRPDERHS